MNTDITQKQYKKLVVQVALNGLTFCCFDTLNNTVLQLREINFDTFQKGIKTEDLFKEAFIKNPELTEKYDEIMVIHSNNLATFVPDSVFDEDYLGSYLQYNTKVFDTDFFTSDSLEKYEIHNVYIPYININNFFIDQFGAFEYKHANTLLVETILNAATKSQVKKMTVHVSTTHFEIIVVENRKLLFFNSFDYKTREDFIYFILFTAEQLNLNPEEFELEFTGSIAENSELYQIAYTYIRNVSFRDDFEIQSKTTLSTLEKRKHFIVLNA